MVSTFVALAADCEQMPEYDVKRRLWRDLLRGAFIAPPDEAAAERDLFARHTLLVVIARAVAETFLEFRQQAYDRPALHRRLTGGFAAWLLDAAEADGEKVIDELVVEIERYDWSFAGRDTLKDLYHARHPPQHPPRLRGVLHLRTGWPGRCARK